jgi:hypothetical protein
MLKYDFPRSTLGLMVEHIVAIDSIIDLGFKKTAESLPKTASKNTGTADLKSDQTEKELRSRL